MTHKIATIIPALNEELTIKDVVNNLYSHGVTQVIVVDNGSTDKTAKIATEAGAVVIYEAQKGYGKACLSGIANLPENIEWVLFCDADGSDDLGSLPTFWECIPEYDLIIGNRRSSAAGRANLTPVQNFGNWLSGFLMKLGWGRGFSDLGPLRLARKESLLSLDMEDENFGWTVEMQAKALEKNLKCKEIPVDYFDRQAGTSKISGNFSASVMAGRIILTTLGMLWLQRSVVQKWLLVLTFTLFLIGSFIMGQSGFGSDPNGYQGFFTGALLMSLGFLLSLGRTKWSFWVLMVGAVLARLLVLPVPPGDDIWRYLWEGHIQLNGFNPYNTPPNAAELTHLQSDQWHNLINHPEVTAIYPPLIQLIFRVLSAISTSVIFFKLVFVAADLATGLLLWRKFGQKAALYLLNPLVITCFAGGGHYEPLFILPMVAAWTLWDNEANIKRLFWIGLLLGASFSIKVASAVAFPFIAWHLVKLIPKEKATVKKLGAYLLGISLPIFGSYFLFSLLTGVPEQLYPEEFATVARSTELVPWFAELVNPHPETPFKNKVFLLPILIALGCIGLFCRTFSGYLTSAFLCIFAFSPMIHVWYFTWIIPFAVKRMTSVILLLSFSGFLYFLLPTRYLISGDWLLTPLERLAFWSPLLLLIPLAYQALSKRLRITGQ